MTRIDHGVVSLLAELRSHERQAAEELGQWKTHREERKAINATSPAAVTLALLLTDEEGIGNALVERSSSREERRLMTDSRGAQRVAPLRLGLCGQIGAIPPPMRNRAASLSVSCRVVIRCREVQG